MDTTSGKPKGDSIRRRYYETTDLDEILQDKIASQLRGNGIPETKVVLLSAKITQAVKDEVIETAHGAQPQINYNLTQAVNKHLDPILYGREDVTDLRDAQKPRDATHITNVLLLKLGQAQEEVENARIASEDGQKTARRSKKGGLTPREEHVDRSQLQVIKDNIEKSRTEREILEEKLRRALADEGDGDLFEKEKAMQDLDAENYELRREIQSLEEDKQRALARLKHMQEEIDDLEKGKGRAEAENTRFRKQLDEMELIKIQMTSDLNRLTSERGRLQVLIDQKDKEIVHLRDPDREMVHQLNVLKEEVTMLRTQTRRLNEEKGALKSRSQKVEATLEDTYKHKGKLQGERDELLKENQDLKQRYRKLALSDPKQRKLPDIFFTRTGPASLGNGSSRAPSRVISRMNESPSRITSRHNESPIKENPYPQSPIKEESYTRTPEKKDPNTRTPPAKPDPYARRSVKENGSGSSSQREVNGSPTRGPR